MKILITLLNSVMNVLGHITTIAAGILLAAVILTMAS